VKIPEKRNAEFTFSEEKTEVARPGKIRKKRIIQGVLLFLLVTMTPLYDVLFSYPERIAVHGNIPAGWYGVQGVVVFRTESFLCRSFSLGTGSFLPTGRHTEIEDAIVDSAGGYHLSQPLEKNSFWCNWRRASVLSIDVNAPPKGARPKSVTVATLLRSDKVLPASDMVIDMECVNVYRYTSWYGDDGKYNKRKTDEIFCRQKNVPLAEQEIKTIYDTAPRIRISSELRQLTLNISFADNGPEYDIHKDASDLWQRYDTQMQYDKSLRGQ
jgi:hypothetical protein